MTVHEKFDYLVDGDTEVITWDVTVAKHFVAAGHVVAHVTVPPEQLRRITERNEWHREKLAAADPTVPGIGAPIIVGGEIVYILIDGTHRAAKALDTGVPFEADLLTDAASRACLLRAPRHRIP